MLTFVSTYLSLGLCVRYRLLPVYLNLLPQFRLVCLVSLFHFAIHRATEKRRSSRYIKLSFDLPELRFVCDVSLFYFAIQRASEKRGSLLYVKLSFDLPQFRFVCLVFLFYFAIQRELRKRGVHYAM